MTEVDFASLLLRLVVGGIFVAQGWRKLFGPPQISHGRLGLERLIREVGVPKASHVALIVSVLELACGGALIAGFLTRVACLPLAGILIVAMRAKWGSGFFGGWDWPLSVLGATISVFLLGPGVISVSHLLRLGAGPLGPLF